MSLEPGQRRDSRRSTLASNSRRSSSVASTRRGDATSSSAGSVRRTALTVKSLGTGKIIRKTSLAVNFDTSLPKLIELLELSLQSSPDDEPVRLKDIRLKRAGRNSGGDGGGGGGSVDTRSDSTRSTALDNTPFAPPRHRKAVADNMVLTEGNFNRDLFLAMSKVYLEADTRMEDRQEAVNDENDRRLSNGGSPPAANAITPDSAADGVQSASGIAATTATEAPVAKGPRGRCRNTHGSCESSASGSSGGPSVSGRDTHLAGPEGKVALPRGSAGECRSDFGDVGTGGESKSPEHRAVRSSSGRGTAGAPDTGGDQGEDSDEQALASPRPGRRSKLFRRASLLPPDVASDGEDSDSRGDEPGDEVGDSGGSGGDGNEDVESRGDAESTDNSSVGRTGGLSTRETKRSREPGRREAVTPRRGGRTDGDRSRDRRVGGSSATGPSCSDSSLRSGSREKLRSGRCAPESGKGASSGDRRGKQRLYPKSGGDTKSAKAGGGGGETGSGGGQSGGGGGGASVTPDSCLGRNTASKTTTSRNQAKCQQSAWAAPPSERRQPVIRAAGTPKAKLPSAARRPATAKAPTPGTGRGTATPRSKSPRPGTEGPRAAAEGKADEQEEGVADASSKILPPRVSAVVPWEKNLRTPSKKNRSPDKKTASKRETRKGGKDGGSSCVGRRGGGGGGLDKGSGGGGSGGGGGDAGNGVDGRPSVGTWEKTQAFLQILKEISGKDEEELEWLAVAKKGQGVSKSERRRESAETEYHRLLCEESMQQAGLTLLQDRRLEVGIKALARLGDDLGRFNDLVEELSEQLNKLAVENDDAQRQEDDRRAAMAAAAAAAALEDQADRWDEAGAADDGVAAAEAFAAARAERSAEMDRLAEAKGEAEAKLSRVLGDIEDGKQKLKGLHDKLREEAAGKEIPQTKTVEGIAASVFDARVLIAPRRAKGALRALEDAAASLKEEMKKTRSASQSALSRMEKWRERKEALPEYGKEMADKERAWFERERGANEEALQRMRGLCPVGVTSLTVAQLEQRAIDAGSLYPRQLALRLKENRLLHWTVEHPDDIARQNFLKGDHAHFFTNLDRYDLVELRAITACLPERFEVDGDGRKAAWRAAFVQRVQGLVAQERGDTVSGGWDPDVGGRRTVRLPGLTPEQKRRVEYFYPTRAEVESRLQKLRERRSKLEEKRHKMENTRDVLLPEARDEYAYVLEDTRHPANKEMYSAEDLRRARDEARAEVDRLTQEVKRLEADVASSERALRDAPYTVESLQAEADRTRALLVERAKRERVKVRAAAAAAAQQEGTEGEQKAPEHPKADAAAAAPEPSESAESTRMSAPGEDDGKSYESRAERTIGGDEGRQASEEEATEEGVEVEGAFDPEPELRSRFADKSSSLRFVTAEEDARMRKEELAKVFGSRSDAAAGAGARAGARAGATTATDVDIVSSDIHRAAEVAGDLTRGVGDSSGKVSREQGTDGPTAAFAGGADATGRKEEGHGPAEGEPTLGGGGAQGRIKAFGAVLEKALSQGMLGRGRAPGLPAGKPRGGKVQHETASSPRAPEASRVLSPPCKPKSKFFKAIRSPEKTLATAGQPGSIPQPLPTVSSPGSPPPPPPLPMPMTGVLSQIRARGGGGAASGDAQAEMSGLLAQIRARAAGVEADKMPARNEKCPPAMPPQIPLPPPGRVPLFGKRGTTDGAAGVQAMATGPPPDFLAEVRAKAARRLASREAQGVE